MIIKRCGCRRFYSKPMWEALAKVGNLDLDEDDDQRLELRNCYCGSTIAIDLKFGKDTDMIPTMTLRAVLLTILLRPVHSLGYALIEVGHWLVAR